MTVKYMPFWFFDIKKAEEKLSKYAEKGLFPVDFKANGRFILEEREPEKVRFRIVRSKGCKGKAPRGLVEKGWANDAGSKNYYIVHKDADSVEQVPSYKGQISVYRTIQTIGFFVICYLLGYSFGISVAIFEDIEKGEAELIAILVAVVPALIGAILAGLFTLKIHSANKKLLAESENSVKFSFTIPEENFIYTKEQEKQMLKSGEMKKKSPAAWITAPDKAEVWVEKMAEEGWKFYRLSKWGNSFYFIKSEPCKLKFCVDYQKDIEDEYISNAKDDGWKLEFASVTKHEGYCIWSKEYTDDEEEPMFYSDSDSALEHAKKYFLSMILPMILIVAMYIFMLADLIFMSGFNGTAAQIIMLVFGAIVIIEYGYFVVRSLGYLLRLKKKNKTNNY